MIDRQTNIPLAIVVAMTPDHVIGKNGTLPWHLPDDLKWFKEITMGKPIIMGRVTYESIGKALPGRDNIVITRNDSFEAPEVTVANDLEDAIAIAEAFAIAREAREVAIIGGAQIYEQALPLTTRIYLTEVDAEIKGDTFFPKLDRAAWKENPANSIKQDGRNDHDARMLTLTRKTDQTRTD